MFESTNMKSKTIATTALSTIILAAALAAPRPSVAAEATQPTAGKATLAEARPVKGDALADWWNGSYATGNWWGVRDTLADHGIVPTVSWRATGFSVPGSCQRS